MQSRLDPKMVLQKQGYLLFDGAMGTYLAEECKKLALPETPLAYEWMNLNQPNLVKQIHQQYIQAGANAIKTNTFGANSRVLQRPFAEVAEVIRAGYKIALEAAAEENVLVFADIGPIPCQKRNCQEESAEQTEILAEYKKIVDLYLALGATNFLLETLVEDDFLPELTAYIKKQAAKQDKTAFIITQFAISADGYTSVGVSGKKIFSNISKLPTVDAFGFNCVCGPTHLLQYIQQFILEDKLISIMPNAGYPVYVNHRMVFDNSPEYFAERMLEIKGLGVKILGGCCGTTPEHIAAIAQKLSANSSQHQMVSSLPEKELGIVRKSPLQQQLEAGKRVIAVEVEPPSTNEIQRLLQTAEQLKLAGADFLTVADCPIARVKADSSMISALLKRQVGIEVIPHLTCRDRNINATKALLLGLQIEEIQTVLLVTGDPLPENVRSEVKSVFQLNASHLCEYVHNLNEENFADTPFFIGAALNVNASNFDVELKRAKQKIAHGANYFLTQPIYSDSAIANVKRAKQELSAYILGGIMPIVSYRNACFINNEISGITIPEEICQRFIEKTPEECRQISIELAYQTCQAIQDVVDGYYITTPLHKVDWVTALMERL